MKTFNMNVTNMPNNTIGFGGENGVTEVVLDFGKWAEEYGQGAISLLVKRAMDTHPYPAVLETEGTTATWVITDVETSYKGHGEAQWIYTVGEQIKKSAVFGFNVDRSLNSPVAETPEAYQTWVDDMIALGAGVEQIAEQVYEATGHYPKVENGYWYVWSVIEEDWVNTNQKAQGEQGIPGVGISSTVLNPDYTLTITLTDGSSYTTPPIKGEKGDTGNGISSTVLNADYTLTITFTNGTTYTTPSIRGAKGDKGDKGDPGDDYVITQEDYQEIADLVDTMISAERQQALDDIDDAKDDAVADVAAEGTTQKGLVASEGTTQVGLVTAKGQEVIQSIPSDYSELSDDVSELKTDLTNKADIIVSSASGAIASFNDGANYPVKQTVFEMNPVQNLNGQEYPYPAGGGKNLLIQMPPTTATINGVTWTVNADGSITANGTANGNSTFNYITPEKSTDIVFDGDYRYKQFPFVQSGIMKIGIKFTSWYAVYSYNASPINGASGKIDTMWFQIMDGQTANVTFYPMIYSASEEQPASWSPYSNICPILGHTEVDAVRTGVNVWDEEWESGQYNGNVSTGLINKSADATRIRSKNDIPVVPNTTYYLKSTQPLFAYFLDSDKNWFNRVGSNGTTLAKNATFTTPDNCYFLKFFTINTATYNHDISINYPSTDHSYHQYSGQSVTYQLGQTVYDGTLTINEDGTGTIVSDMASVDLGTLTWTYRSAQTMFTASFSNYKKPIDNTSTPNLLFSQYRRTNINVMVNTLNDFRGTVGRPNNLDNFLMIRDTRFSTASDFKTEVTGQQLVYELETPIIINLTEQEVIETLYGNNNIWHDANGDTEVQYRADTKLYIDNKIATLLSV